MSAILHCGVNCGGAVKESSSSKKCCDIDGASLTPEYRSTIKEYGCAFYTEVGTPRKNSRICNGCFKAFRLVSDNQIICGDCEEKQQRKLEEKLS